MKTLLSDFVSLLFPSSKEEEAKHSWAVIGGVFLFIAFIVFVFYITADKS